MDLPGCRTVYSGDGITDHNQLIDFLLHQQSQIESLQSELKALRAALSSSGTRKSLYDAAGAHRKPL
jgi:prefoldin subunit 5